MLFIQGINGGIIDLIAELPAKISPKYQQDGYTVPLIASDFIFKHFLGKKIKFSVTPDLKSWFSSRKKKHQLLEKIKKGATCDKTLIPSAEVDIDKKFSLKKYQETLIRFGYIAKRFLIADDVGLGKTLMVVALSRILFNRGEAKNVLFVVPAPLIENFYDDIVKFFPKEKSIIKIGAETKKKRESKFNQVRIGKTKYVITNYEKFFHDYSNLMTCKFDMVVCDEGHKLKSIVSEKPAKMAVNFFRCLDIWNPKFRVMMSGTPIENMLMDLFPVYKFLDSGIIFGGKEFFECNFVNWTTKIIRVKNHWGGYSMISQRKADGFKNTKYLNHLAKPRFIRRKRSEVLAELPEHVHKVIKLTMSMKEKKQYKILENELTGQPGAKQMGLRRFIGNPEYSFPHEKFNSMAKLDQLKSDFRNTAGKILVFCFFIEEAKWIADELKKEGHKMLWLTGEITDKSKIIKKFSTDPKIKGLVATDCINYGVNGLQCSQLVIDYSLPHKPSVLQQRHGRIHRLGKTNKTVALSYVLLQTADEKIWASIQTKQNIIDHTVEKIDSDIF